MTLHPNDEQHQQPAPEPSDDIHFQWGVRIPMRDGVHLQATVYRPNDPTPAPTVFTLTPYVADSYHDRAYYFARRGFSFLLVDCRGRGNSEGEFEPFRNEGQDGHDVVQWLAEQEWCDGQVAMWGGSYAGFDQWATLKELPAALQTIVPAASAHPAVDFPFFQNIYSSYDIQWLTFTSGGPVNAKLFGESGFWHAKFQELYNNHIPFSRLDRVVGNLSTHFQTWLAHPKPDDYWLQMVPTPEQYRAMDVPILSITGHYDGDQPGALHFYREHMRHASPAARARHYLIIGPWDHAGTRTPAREVGGLTFGEACLVDLNALHHDWYTWTMLAGARPAFLQDRVAYYVMGADEWRYAPDLDSVTGETRRLYLHAPDGLANDVFRSGELTTVAPPPGPRARYVYDPLDLRPAENAPAEDKHYLTNQTDALNLYGNGLVFHSAPFDYATEVTGFLRLVAWLEIDVPDTDFAAVLYEVLPDGSAIKLSETLIRARYRDSLTEERLVVPGDVNRYVFDHFTFFSRRLAARSRLRLLLQCPNTPYLQKNYNGGGVVAEESRADARTAMVVLHQDADHRSYLELPIGAAA